MQIAPFLFILNKKILDIINFDVSTSIKSYIIELSSKLFNENAMN